MSADAPGRQGPVEVEAAIAEMEELRRWTRRIVWTVRSHWERRHWVIRQWVRIGLPMILSNLLITLPRQARSTLAHAGREVRRLHGIPLRRQLRQMLELAVRWGLYPREYYLHGLYLEGRTRLAPLYLGSRRNGESLVAAIGTRDPQWGKPEFFQRCRSASLSVAPVLAETVRDGPPVIHDPGSRLWNGDLFSKPASLGAGVGLSLWYRQEDGGWTNGETTVQHRDELLSTLASARGGSQIVQPRLVTHPALGSLTTGGLCTVRVNTVRDPASGRVDVLFALFRMPRGAAGDNISLGGIGAGVDLATGRLRRALPDTGDHLPVFLESHPDTGAAIEGTPIPQWEELLELARQVHGAFPETPAGGWDIGVTDTGPVLVEANEMWGCDLMQVTNDTPIGLTAYPRVMLKYIKAAAVRRALSRRF